MKTVVLNEYTGKNALLGNIYKEDNNGSEVIKEKVSLINYESLAKIIKE